MGFIKLHFGPESLFTKSLRKTIQRCSSGRFSKSFIIICFRILVVAHSISSLRRPKTGANLGWLRDSRKVFYMCQKEERSKINSYTISLG